MRRADITTERTTDGQVTDDRPMSTTIPCPSNNLGQCKAGTVSPPWYKLGSPPPGDALGRTTVSVPFFAARVTLCTSAAYAVVWCLSSPSGVSHICVLCINQQTWSQTFSLSGTVNKTHHTPYKLKNCHV